MMTGEDVEALTKGRTQTGSWRPRRSFDGGTITVDDGGERYEVTYVNEYMTLELGGRRLATFPDLICTFDGEGDPATSAAIEEGDRVFLTVTDKGLIPVGDGNRYPEVYEPIEEALGKSMVGHLSGFLRA